jgi:hypothetical protein
MNPFGCLQAAIPATRAFILSLSFVLSHRTALPLYQEEACHGTVTRGPPLPQAKGLPGDLAFRRVTENVGGHPRRSFEQVIDAVVECLFQHTAGEFDAADRCLKLEWNCHRLSAAGAHRSAQSLFLSQGPVRLTISETASFWLVILRVWSTRLTYWHRRARNEVDLRHASRA